MSSGFNCFTFLTDLVEIICSDAEKTFRNPILFSLRQTLDSGEIFGSNF